MSEYLPSGIYPHITQSSMVYTPIPGQEMPLRYEPVKPDVNPADQIDWNALPSPLDPSIALAAKQIAKTRKVVAPILLTLGLGSAAATTYVAVYFTTTSLSLFAATFSGLALLTLALTVGGVYALFKSFPNDPKEMLKQRQAAGKEINENTGYEAIRSKYLKKIVTDEDVNALIYNDVLTLSYSDFIKKHGKGVISILSRTNLAHLSKSFRDECLKEKGWVEIAAKTELSTLIPEEDIAAFRNAVVTAEVSRLKGGLTDYQLFIDRNGMDAITWTDLSVRHILVEAFKNHVLNQPIGSITFESRFAKELEKFRVDNPQPAVRDYVKITIREAMISRDLLKFKARELDYATFTELHDIAIVAQMLGSNELYLADLRQRFLALPFAELTSKARDKDREALQISPVAFKTAVLQHLNQDTLAGLMKGTGRNNLCLYNELRPYFKEKALKDTAGMSVCDIARTYPQLISMNVIEASDTAVEEPGSPSIQERLESEISRFSKLEDLLENVPDLLFENGWLHAKTPIIAKLVANYVVRNPVEFLEGLTPSLVVRGSKKAFNSALIKDVLNHCIEKHKKEYAAQKRRYSETVFQIKKNCATGITAAQQTKDAAIEASKRKVDLSTKQSLLAGLEKNVQETTEKERELSQKLTPLNLRLDSLPAEILSMQLELSNLQKRLSILQPAKTQASLLQQEISTKQANLTRLVAQVPMDSVVVRLNQEIAANEHGKRALISQRDELQAAQTRQSQLAVKRQAAAELAREVRSDKFVAERQALTVQVAKARPAMEAPREFTGLRGAVTVAREVARENRDFRAKEGALGSLDARAGSLAALEEEVRRLEVQQPKEDVADSLRLVELRLLENSQGYLRLVAQREQAMTQAKARLQLSTLEQEIARLQATLTALQINVTEANQTQAKIDKLSSSLASLRSEHARLLVQVPQLKRDLEEARRQKETASTNCVRARSLFDSAQEEVRKDTAQAMLQLTLATSKLEGERDQELAVQEKAHFRALDSIKEEFCLEIAK